MSWKNTREVNPGVKVNLWFVNPRVNLSMEQSALSGLLISFWAHIKLLQQAELRTDGACRMMMMMMCHNILFSFSALMLMVGWQEEYPARRKTLSANFHIFFIVKVYRELTVICHLIVYLISSVLLRYLGKYWLSVPVKGLENSSIFDGIVTKICVMLFLTHSIVIY